MLSIQALKRKLKNLQETYDLQSEELKRLRNAYAIETDPSHKFKYEKQIEHLEKECEQLGQQLAELERQLEITLNGVEGPPFQWDYKTFSIDFSAKVGA